MEKLIGTLMMVVGGIPFLMAMLAGASAPIIYIVFGAVVFAGYKIRQIK